LEVRLRGFAIIGVTLFHFLDKLREPA